MKKTDKQPLAQGTPLQQVFEPRSPMAAECIEPGDVECPHTDVCPECWTDGSGSPEEADR